MLVISLGSIYKVVLLSLWESCSFEKGSRWVRKIPHCCSHAVYARKAWQGSGTGFSATLGVETFSLFTHVHNQIVLHAIKLFFGLVKDIVIKFNRIWIVGRFFQVKYELLIEKVQRQFYMFRLLYHLGRKCLSAMTKHLNKHKQDSSASCSHPCLKTAPPLHLWYVALIQIEQTGTVVK